MFAFAIWDSKKKRLFAARDRFGKKPFYYTQTREGFIFGSELKSLLQHPSVQKETDPVAVHHYLTLQYVPDPYSIYKNIFKLPPAHFLVFEANKYRTARYWDFSYTPKLKISENEAKEQLWEIIREAVRKRLISDVPLGAFLSGGIDSSIVVSLMADISTGPVKTFSIGFDYESFNELPYARAVAEKYSTDHVEFIVKPETVAEIIPKIVDIFDEPFADSCAFQMYYLARLTRQHVTVVLNGDGGDETFAGYPRYWLDRYVKPYAALPRFITQAMVPNLVGWMREPTNVPVEANWIMGLKRLSQVAKISPKASIIRWGSYFSEDMKRACFNDKMASLVDGHRSDVFLAEFFDRAVADSFLDRTLYTDMLNYLPGNNLVKMDRMTMAHGLEARSPLLDKKYVEFSAHLPESMKIKGRQTKYLLRKISGDILPKNIQERGKRGFAAPIEEWLKKDLKGLTNDTILSQNANIYNFFRRDHVQKMVNEHQNGRINHGRRIWTLLILEEWCRKNQ
jgi:asparagine synthase (glutamine-hydrolysing)